MFREAGLASWCYVYRVSLSILIWSWISRRESVGGERSAKISFSLEVPTPYRIYKNDTLFCSTLLKDVTALTTAYTLTAT